MIAAVETGGTKIFCAVATRDDPETLIDTVRIPTTAPDETLAAIHAFLQKHNERSGLEAIGFASFGPLETDPRSPRYGWIGTTPKAGWKDADLHRALGGMDDVPVAFVTDVTGSLLGEGARGAALGLRDYAYVTVGTGIGVGVESGGNIISGHGTPEIGHMMVRRHPDDHFAGICAFHGDCLEGLASGPAVHARWGRPAEGQERDIVAYYIAQLIVTLTLTLAPARIVLGGGVPKTPGLLELIRAGAADITAGYLGDDHPIQDTMSGFVVPPALGDLAGVQGALVLAESLLA